MRTKPSRFSSRYGANDSKALDPIAMPKPTAPDSTMNEGMEDPTNCAPIAELTPSTPDSAITARGPMRSVR